MSAVHDERIAVIRDARARLAMLVRLGTPGAWTFTDVTLDVDRETFSTANVTVDMWDVATCSGGMPEPGNPIEQQAIADAALIAAMRSTVEAQLRIFDDALKVREERADDASAQSLANAEWLAAGILAQADPTELGLAEGAGYHA